MSAGNNPSAKVDLLLRILPNNTEIHIDVPLSATGGQLLQKLLENASNFGIPTTDRDGNRFSFQLINKQAGREVSVTETLFQNGMRQGNTLLLVPILTGG
jgi:hypothetical protein